MSAPIDADVVIVGVGTCGEDLSLRLLEAGLDVVGIEADLIGGECPYWACIPTKVMVAAGRTVDLSGLGLETIGLDPAARHIEVDDRIGLTTVLDPDYPGHEALDRMIRERGC